MKGQCVALGCCVGVAVCPCCLPSHTHPATATLSLPRPRTDAHRAMPHSAALQNITPYPITKVFARQIYDRCVPMPPHTPPPTNRRLLLVCQHSTLTVPSVAVRLTTPLFSIHASDAAHRTRARSVRPFPLAGHTHQFFCIHTATVLASSQPPLFHRSPHVDQTFPWRCVLVCECVVVVCVRVPCCVFSVPTHAFAAEATQRWRST
jgi:hypothetical protein